MLINYRVKCFFCLLVEETGAFLLGQLSAPPGATDKPAFNFLFPPCQFLHSTDRRDYEQIVTANNIRVADR